MNNSINTIRKKLCAGRILRRLTAAVTVLSVTLQAHAVPPRGHMLNLDLQHIEEGLIPNKALYPLYVPLGDLETAISNERTVIMIKEGQSLNIPHSALLDPDGSGWMASIRVFALTDGMVMSQSDGEKGFAIFIKDGAVQAAIQTGHSTLFLKERPENGITECLNKWVSIELIIKADVAILSLNRAHVALLPMQAPLNGNDYRIHIGQHETLPTLLTRSQAVEPTGFTGAVSSLKIMRQ